MGTPRVTSDKWFVRVDGELLFLRQKCGELSQWIDTHSCHGVFHVGATTKENPHAHIIMSMTSVLQKQSFDVRIKKLFEIQSRNAYSTKPWDGRYEGETAGSYLYHEGNDSPVLCNKGFTELHINAFKEANALVQKVVKANKEKANTKLIGKALEAFKNAPFNNELECEVFTYMLKECRDGANYYPGDFQIKKFVQEVCMKLCPGNQFEEYAFQKYRDLFCR